MVDIPTLLIASVTARAGFFLIFLMYSFRAYAAKAYRFWALSIVASATGIWLTYSNGDYPVFSAMDGALIYSIIGLSLAAVWAGAQSFFGRPISIITFLFSSLLPGLVFWGSVRLPLPPAYGLTLTLCTCAYTLAIASRAFLVKSRARRLPSQTLVGAALALYTLALLFSAATLAVGILMGRPDLGPESANIFVAMFIDQLVSVLIYVGLVAMTLEEAQMQMQEIATTDPLTGLANRRGLQERTRAVIGAGRRRKRPMSVLIADIDHFKAINDRYGHECGDMVLKQFADVLGATVKRQQDVVARWGGEEFVVLLHDAPLNDALALANIICRRIEATPFDIKTEHIRVTVSIGVAALFEEAADLDQALAIADASLYEAKHTGRNRVCPASLALVE
jgi:diguanylate cyclase (GGDEF)-like protein